MTERLYPGYTFNMKTAISIPDNLFAEAEQMARQLGMSRSELYARAVEAYLEEHRDETITDILNQLYTVEESSLDPFLQQLQVVSLTQDEW